MGLRKASWSWGLEPDELNEIDRSPQPKEEINIASGSFLSSGVTAKNPGLANAIFEDRDVGFFDLFERVVHEKVGKNQSLEDF